METDRQEQEDEMLAMQSIFDQDTFCLNSGASCEGDIRSGQIKIHLDLPESFSVFDGSKRDPQNVVDQDQAKYSVQFLLPLTLHFTLPKDYPSKSKPNFTLASNWLHRAALSLLSRKLDNLWEDNKGIGVLFTWTSYLQSNSLTDLGITEYYDVTWFQNPFSLFKTNLTHNAAPSQSISAASSIPGPSTKCKTRHRQRKIFLDPRVVSESIPRKAENVINLLDHLLTYNEEQIMASFLQSSHTCEICFSIKMGHSCIRFLCGHIFCKDCVSGYFTTHITEGDMEKVKCLAVDCQMRPTPETVSSLVGDELYNRYDEILLKRALEEMKDVMYCPRPKCQSPVIYDPGDKGAFCMVCGYNFCTACKMGYHGVEPCPLKDAEMKVIGRKYEESTEEEKRQLEKEYGIKQLKQFAENSRSEQWIMRESKPCPNCRAPIEKFEGCNKVHCAKCHNSFCWLCGELLYGNPYTHFNDPKSKCYNKTFLREGEEGDENGEGGGGQHANEWVVGADADDEDAFDEYFDWERFNFGNYYR